MNLMHEWVLISIECDWKSGRVTFSFGKHSTGGARLVAEGVVDLHVPWMKPWGESVHVNEVRGPLPTPENLRKVEIEMQSGDVITVTAASFLFPAQAQGASALETTTPRMT
jgi:hypothetical protein